MMLAEKHLSKQSVKKVLKACGLDHLDEYHKPLKKMSSEKGAQAVLKWITCNSIIAQKYLLRIKIADDDMPYEIQLVNRNRGSIYITHFKRATELKGKVLHCWLPDVSYHKLTADEINRSVQRADAINKLKEDLKYMVAIWRKSETKTAEINKIEAKNETTSKGVALS